MAFDPASYRNRILLAEGDFLLEFTRRGITYEDVESPVRPRIVQDVAEAFLDAGADLLLTHTAGANPLIQAEREGGHPPDAEALFVFNRDAAAMLRATISDYPRPADRPVFLLGTLGPLERLLMLDEIDESSLFDAYRAQAEALAAGGVDAILCDGFSEVDALATVVRAARDGTGLPLIATVVVDAGPERTETPLGATVPQVCETLADAGAEVIGFSAGEEPDNAAAVASLFRASCDLPLWAEVSPGQPQLIEERVVYPEGPEEFASRLGPMKEAGISIFRPGTGSTPDHLAALTTLHPRSGASGEINR